MSEGTGNDPSVLCKLMERIVLKRLESHVESNQLLDPQQEDFRRYHSTTYAVTRLMCVQEFSEQRFFAFIFIRAD